METEGTLPSAWDQHLASEFAAKSADQALATMTAEPYVDVVPLMIGARGRIELHDFYANNFLSQIPPDMEIDRSARSRSTDSEASLRGNSSSAEERPLSHARIPETIMSAPFVLVHGAWLGGWCWKKVTPLLRAAGHEVFVPTLTGLGERSHLFSPEVGLDTHIEDIVAVLEYEDLTDVILVGHSYAGMVIAGAAQKAAHRLAELVYLDSFLPESGKSLDDYLPAPLPSVDGRIKPFDLRTAFGVSREADIAWAAPRLRDHPARADSQPVDLSRTVNLRQTYIRCSNNFPFFEESAERAKRQGFWFYELMSANHCPMVTQPDELVKILLALV